MDQLVGVLKTNSLKALCEAGKIASNWCRYKELLELNAAYVQQQKSVKRKSACWPGLPWPCDKRLSRAVHSGNEFDYDPKKVNDINAYNNVFKNSKDYDIPYDTDSVSDVNADEYDESSDDDDKRALKCRPGLANCRGRKKGKRTLEKAPPKTKDCPQGWMYCL